MFSCTLQILISLGQHSFELLTFIVFAIFQVLYLFEAFWQLVFAYLCPRVVGTTADFSRWGRYVPFFPQSGFGFSYPAVSYLVSF